MFRTSVEPAAIFRLAPVAIFALAAAAMAWREHGSIAAEDWLPYGVLAGMLLVTVLLFADANRPSPFLLAALGALAGLSLWTALSVAWSPVPSLARDEALLISVYGFSLALPPLTLKGESSRLGAPVVVALTASALAVAAAAKLIDGALPEDFTSGRLTFPVSYVNANAAIFLVGFWSAVALAASRAVPAVVRAPALGSATALLAAWLVTQSKGGGIALGASAVVVLALAPGRLRLLLPLLVPAGLVAAAYRPLTAPFRAEEAELVAAGRRAGEALLVLAGLGLVVGVGYAIADRRMHLSARARRAGGVVAVAALAAALVSAAAAFAVRVDHPARFFSDRWEEFKTLPDEETGGSHLVNLGSNRYDFWRVELAGFREHPLAGVGGRGFGTVYLEERRSRETPARGHSLPFDALLETGIVGFVLLATAFSAILVGLVRRAAHASGVAALGTVAYFSVHASGDWVWTFPAVGVPVFVLAGAALAPDDDVPLRRRTSLAAGALAALVTLAFVPPLLSARITEEALRTGDPDGLAAARRLDPLSVDPWFAEAALARTAQARIDALRHGLEREPRSTALRLLLGRTLLEAGRREEALAELERARRLDPRGDEVAAELQRARRAENGS